MIRSARAPRPTRESGHLVATESGVVRKDHRGRLGVVLAYPNTYFVGMSNLGVNVMYHLFNSCEDIVCERAFLPDEAASRPPLRTVESGCPVGGFQILAFSISFENDYLNVLRMLEYARLALRSRDRTAKDPLVVAGGAAVTMNPEPLAEIIDAFVIGEGETAAPPVLERLLAAWRDGTRREDLLAELASLPGVYVPSLYRARWQVDGAFAGLEPTGGAPADIAEPPQHDIRREPAHTRVYSPHTEFGDRFLLEVSRGCRSRCKFCMITYVTQSYRSVDLEVARSLCDGAIATGHEIGLIGAALTDYPHVEELTTHIVARGGRFSMSSVPFHRVSEQLAANLAAAGHRSVTLAPESGSERIRRRVVGKAGSNEDLVRAAVMLLGAGLSDLKLYLIVGNPTETEEEVIAIGDLVEEINARARAAHGRTPRRITCSASTFVPKPHTPFQFAGQIPVPLARRRLRALTARLRSIPNVRLNTDYPKWAYVQALLSRGDRKVGDILIAAHQAGGDWARALRGIAAQTDWYVVRARLRNEVTPWDHIAGAASEKERLWRSYQTMLDRAAEEGVRDRVPIPNAEAERVVLT
ncbi:MAG: radical SAM protein [Candidatus Schekmanbacteria bacterium]|nr:radical SAM protein [Candidatus Schekmanbacteria bacterium]